MDYIEGMDYFEGYVIDVKRFKAAHDKSERERKWYEENFGLKVIVSEIVPVGELYAVNPKGILDDMRSGKSYKEAVLKNSARITTPRRESNG